MDASYKQYFDSMPCFLTVQDRDFRIIDANRAFREGFGDYEGRYCYQVYKRRPEKCEICPVERSFRDGQPHGQEEVVTTLDGQEMSVVVYTTPIRDESGKIISVMEMSTDITEIKQQQKQHKESQERYRLLFEEVPCYISIQDRDMRIMQANRPHREAFGACYGCKCYEVLKHRSEECLPCVVRETFKHGTINQREEVVTSLDGKQRYVLVTAAPIKNESGEIDSVIEMSADITPIRELQDKLTSVGLLISSISHDIKGLLNILDGGIYMVSSGIKKNKTDRINQGWEVTLRSIDRIRSLVLNILYYAKDREPAWERVTAGDIIGTICDQFERKIKELSIELDRDVDSAEEEFEADRNALHSLLANLLENSMDACRVDKAKGIHQITIGFKNFPGHVQFEIADNGIGMDQETADRAFSLFYSSKGAGGTGLGLFISDKIAKEHGGRIVVDSELGRGTRFTVHIPKNRPKETSATTNITAG
ncbi:MAG: PAS domain-containing sensor histidine kinase [Pseudomonadota bacterium]